MTHVAIKATVEWRLLLGTTEGLLNNTTTWSSISCDRHRADHVTKITARPDLLVHLSSPVLEGEVCAPAGVCDNEVSFKRMTISSCSQSGACSLAVVALFWNLSVLGVLEVHTSLAIVISMLHILAGCWEKLWVSSYCGPVCTPPPSGAARRFSAENLSASAAWTESTPVPLSFSLLIWRRAL